MMCHPIYLQSERRGSTSEQLNTLCHSIYLRNVPFGRPFDCWFWLFILTAESTNFAKLKCSHVTLICILILSQNLFVSCIPIRWHTKLWNWTKRRRKLIPYCTKCCRNLWPTNLNGKKSLMQSFLKWLQFTSVISLASPPYLPEVPLIKWYNF